MSYTYPEWRVPEGVDKVVLALEVQQALDYYEARGAVEFLCYLAEDRGWVSLSKVLRVTLVGKTEMSLEGHLERINGVYPLLGGTPNITAFAERRVIWLNQLKEKLS